jgi:hypothetical protein
MTTEHFEPALTTENLTSSKRADADADADLDRLADEWKAYLKKAMQAQETEWRAGAKVVSWIDPEPVWVSASEWDWGDSPEMGFPPDPPAPCKRIFRFSLIGGGQIRVTEDWRYSEMPSPVPPWLNSYRPRLMVRAHTSEGLVSVAGRIEHICSEMIAKAVVFVRGASQTIADRVAATLRAIDVQSANFHALLDGSEGCAFCRRPLRDEISKLIGVGPDCARQHRIPHNAVTANKRLELRRKLLREQP